MDEKSELNEKGVMHLAALVLGIISIVTAAFWYITTISGILAIIFGVKSARRTGSKLGKTGMILGIIGLSLFALIYLGLTGLILLSRVSFLF